MTTETNLVADLRQFTGTTQYYIQPLYRWMKYTDGVHHFVEKAGAYWFLNIVGTELHDLAKKEEFMTVDLIVRDDNAEILVTDGNDTVLWKRKPIYTDCPTGTYRFFLQHNVFMLNWEY